MTQPPDHRRPLRKRRWVDRLQMPVSSVVHFRSSPRSSRASQSSTETKEQLSSETKESSIDDIYLGGELPEDPFARGPIVILGRPRTTSAPSVFGKKSYRESKPLPPTPTYSSSTDDDPLSAMEDDVATSAGSGSASIFSRSEECESEPSSPCSDTTFYTCLSQNAEDSYHGHRFSSTKGDFAWHDSTPTQPPRKGPLFGQRTMKSLPETSDDEDDGRSSPDPSHSYLESPSNIGLYPEFAKAAAEELSPLALTAAGIAYDRRDPCSLRRANSSPLLHSRRKRPPPERKATSCPSTTSDSRPPSYSSGEQVPGYWF